MGDGLIEMAALPFIGCSLVAMILIIIFPQIAALAAKMTGSR